MLYIGLGGSNGHKFRNLELPDIVDFDRIISRDGVFGGSNGTVFRIWNLFIASYDKEIASNRNYNQFIQIKWDIKFNNNQN